MLRLHNIWEYLTLGEKRMRKFENILNGTEFQQYKFWNKLNMGPTFQKIYAYKDTKYNSENILDLLRFLRNIKEHHMEYELSIEEADYEVQRLYPNFLNKLYTCLYEGTFYCIYIWFIYVYVNINCFPQVLILRNIIFLIFFWVHMFMTLRLTMIHPNLMDIVL